MQDFLSERVLVLNRLWQAVNIISARRAFPILFQNHGKVIHSENGDFRLLDATDWLEFSNENAETSRFKSIRTVDLTIRVPKIVILSHYDRLPMKEVKFTRHNLFERDRHTCQYCGQVFVHRGLNLDLVIPRDRGGKTTWENVVASCIGCNSKKGNRLPHEADMRLNRKPFCPRFRPSSILSWVLRSTNLGPTLRVDREHTVETTLFPEGDTEWSIAFRKQGC